MPSILVGIRARFARDYYRHFTTSSKRLHYCTVIVPISEILQHNIRIRTLFGYMHEEHPHVLFLRRCIPLPWEYLLVLGMRFGKGLWRSLFAASYSCSPSEWTRHEHVKKLFFEVIISPWLESLIQTLGLNCELFFALFLEIVPRTSRRSANYIWYVSCQNGTMSVQMHRGAVGTQVTTYWWIQRLRGDTAYAPYNLLVTIEVRPILFRTSSAYFAVAKMSMLKTLHLQYMCWGYRSILSNGINDSCRMWGHQKVENERSTVLYCAVLYWWSKVSLPFDADPNRAPSPYWIQSVQRFDPVVLTGESKHDGCIFSGSRHRPRTRNTYEMLSSCGCSRLFFYSWHSSSRPCTQLQYRLPPSSMLHVRNCTSVRPWSCNAAFAHPITQ